MSIGRLASWTGLGATLLGVLAGVHGREDDVIGAGLVVIACTIIVAFWGE